MKEKLQTNFHTRQYMLSKDFEIYYYSDMRQPKVQNHTHNYYEFYFFLEGNVAITIDGTVYPLKTGDVILIPPDVSHFVTVFDESIPYRRFVFWISQDFFKELSLLCEDYIYVMRRTILTKEYVFHYDVISFNALQAKVFSLIEELQGERFGKSAKVSLCVKDLILHLNRTVYEFDHFIRTDSGQTLSQGLLQYIEMHLDEELTLDRLAKEFYVSKYHIAHIFKEHLGLPIHQYITKKRLAICRDAILSNTSISEAYIQCGFKDYSSFYRAFKKEYGMSPKEYKEMYSLSPNQPS